MGIGGDKISELPDHLLHHILSFLPTKCVIGTCILSKRWRYLWTSIPKLDFKKWRSGTHSLSFETNRFMDFMDKLFLVRGSSYIQTFELFSDEDCDESRVYGWISTVIKCKAKELILFVRKRYIRSPFMFPACIFTCESLVRLQLVGQNSELILPNSIFFPRLKVLELDMFKLTDDTLTQKLFSNCPVLEKLIIKRCSWEDMKILSMSAPALKCLVIISWRIFEMCQCVMKIYAPGLLSFRYNYVVPKEFDLHRFPSLVDADINFYINPIEYLIKEMSKAETGHSAKKLLRGLSNVKRLIISYETLQCLSFADDLFANHPTFYNLIYLEVSSRFFTSTGSSRALLCLLQNSPQLESLRFAEGVYSEADGNDFLTLDVVPPCFELVLKSVEFHNFFLSSMELNVVKLFLRNARVLEKMTIRSRNYLPKNYLEVKQDIMDQLQMVPWASSSCVVDLLWKK